jgi:hypothetical protein
VGCPKDQFDILQCFVTPAECHFSFTHHPVLFALSDIFMLDPEPINWCIIPNFPIAA